MVDSQENFDNICINSQDSDVDFEIKTNFAEVNSNKFSPNHKESLPNVYYGNNKKFPNGHDMKKILIDESTSDSDEVTFIREISKPLLRNGNKKKISKKRLNLKYRKQWTEIIGFCFIVTVILGILIFCLFLLVPNNTFKYLKNKLWDDNIYNNNNNNIHEIVGCDEISIEDIWIKGFPQLLTEGAVRLLKINEDDIFDFVIPFGTNVREEIVCKIYFPDQKRCYGGLLAVDGATGDFLWRYDSISEMYALVCLEDLNKDGWIDCLGAGRQGSFAAVSGRDGSEIWAFDKIAERHTFMNLYTAQFIDDINGDGIRDILQMHGGDPVAQPNEMNRLIAKVMIFSGKTGEPLVSKIVPDLHESYYSPQLINLGDGVKTILFGTGGETFPGSLFKYDLNNFLNFGDKKLKSETVYKSPKKGVMTPPVLVDLNGDKRPDVVMCPFGDECFALDGVTLKEIWKFNSINNSETYVTPAVGFYNDDDVPDIFIQYFVGLGYPVYFYGETLILDGRNGKLLKKLHRSNNLVITSPLTLSVEGHGNDLFLYWLQLCRGHETDTNDVPFQNLPQYILARAHVCKIRFNTTTESLFLIHGQHIKNQSVNYGQIYNSEKYFHVERSHIINVTEQVEKFLRTHPQYRKFYELYRSRLELTDLSKADSSYAKENNDAHQSIIKEQLKSENIDLNDKSVHGSIDFARSDVDQSNANQNDQSSENPFSNLEKKMHRFIRSGEEKLLRFKRHNGPHDAEGLQRLISTGTLTPPLLDKKDKFYNHSMDIVFVTYWSEAKEIVLQTKLEMKCNSEWAKLEYQRFRNSSKFFFYDHDHYSKYGNLYCAKKYGYRKPVSNNENQSTMFNNHFGELTVYRKRIKCTCSPGRVQANQRCSRLLPFHLQTWPAYLGLSGTSYWNSTMATLKLLNRV